ncbi:hypothetical protein [Runella sp.]|uniref:hypothetical protein n=1 Tax=Runella sp. TaxID=1960881 RepID=UPI003D0A4C00
MNYARVFLLILFSSLIGLMAILKPAFANVKKQIALEKRADSSCPDSENDCPFDEENAEGEGDSEGGDELEALSYPIFNVPILKKSSINFTYRMLIPEHFTSISIPPPESC